MEIVLIRGLNPYFESSASANRYTSIIDGLIRNGANVTLIVTNGYNNISEFKLSGIKAPNSNLNIKYTITTFNHNIWLRRINGYLLSGINAWYSNFKLKRYFVEQQYDFLWLTNDATILHFFVRNHKKLNYKKSIIELNEFNDIYKQDGHISNPKQYKKAKDADETFLKAIDRIDLFAVMTQTLISYYKQLTTNKNAVFFHLPMTVDLNRFSEVKNSTLFRKPYIAFTGTYTNQKDGVDILIHAFGRIANDYPDYHLYLAGFYHWDVTMQKKLIDNYGLAKRITYLNVLDKETIPGFIQDAELLVLSRPDSHQAQGGFPTKLGEYLASGNPVCVTKVGEIPYYLEDNISAFLAEPGDSASFADAMQRALSDKKRAEKVGIKGKEVAQIHFNMEIQAKRLMEFLRSNL
ncbi:hypothetical protein AGMMS50239_25370 [Bacteroidia bacterium]|nr:hypothetical protein AGMMS50239_25210 [Bacteroidia bacterium]GHT65488.1 hypothetical protein AGMMS50239_25370 [Bacteroidia bacterium]